MEILSKDVPHTPKDLIEQMKSNYSVTYGTEGRNWVNSHDCIYFNLDKDTQPEFVYYKPNIWESKGVLLATDEINLKGPVENLTISFNEPIYTDKEKRINIASDIFTDREYKMSAHATYDPLSLGNYADALHYDSEYFTFNVGPHNELNVIATNNLGKPIDQNLHFDINHSEVPVN